MEFWFWMVVEGAGASVRGAVLAWGDWVVPLAGWCRRKVGGRAHGFALECDKPSLFTFSDLRGRWPAEGVRVAMCHPAVLGRELSE